MIRALILAYEFPPFISVASLRPYSWHNCFKKFGIEPTVITRQWDNKYNGKLDYIASSYSKSNIVKENKNGKIIYAPYKPSLSNKLLLKNSKLTILQRIAALYDFFTTHLLLKGPKSSIYKEAKTLLQKEKFDVIIASGDPFVLFIYAATLSKEHKIPWIADYRDAWSNDFSIQNNKPLMLLNRLLERKYVSTASKIITVSEYIKNHIEQVVKNVVFEIIPNGFDNEITSQIIEKQDNSETLIIGHAGSVFDWHPIYEFLKKVNFIISNYNCKVQINFYGLNIQKELEQFIEKEVPDIKPHIIFFDKMSNENVVTELSTCNALLLFNYYAHMGTKIYDYLGIKRKIIFCYDNDPDAEILKQTKYNSKLFKNTNENLQKELILETNSGVIVENSNHLVEVIQDLCNEKLNHKQIKCNSINIDNYSRTKQAYHLSEVVKNVVKNEK